MPKKPGARSASVASNWK